MFIYRLIDVKKYVKFYVNKIVVVILVVMYGVTIFTYYLKNNLISTIILGIVIVFSVIENINSVNYLKEIVKTKIKKGI